MNILSPSEEKFLKDPSQFSVGYQRVLGHRINRKMIIMLETFDSIFNSTSFEKKTMMKAFSGKADQLKTINASKVLYDVAKMTGRLTKAKQDKDEKKWEKQIRRSKEEGVMYAFVKRTIVDLTPPPGHPSRP